MRIAAKKKFRFLKWAVVLSVAALLVFTAVTILVNGDVSDTLVDNFFAAFKVEAMCTAAIRVFEYLEQAIPKRAERERDSQAAQPDEEGCIG